MISSENINSMRLQFISHENSRFSYVEGCIKALEGGCRWIQLRMKESTPDDIAHNAEILLPYAKEYEAVLIIDDHVDVCKRVGAHGVHLGKNDMSPEEARKILGDSKIIGGTCNTFDDILRIDKFVDYIGCGPFRYTSTKKNLAPLLGLDGYRELVWKCRSQSINIPIVAIGGITINDVEDIINAGANGIAISGEILNADDPKEMTRRFADKLL